MSGSSYFPFEWNDDVSGKIIVEANYRILEKIVIRHQDNKRCSPRCIQALAWTSIKLTLNDLAHYLEPLLSSLNVEWAQTERSRQFAEY